jgi:peroxiredoxin
MSEQETEMRALLTEAYPAREASDGLHRRVAALAEQAVATNDQRPTTNDQRPGMREQMGWLPRGRSLRLGLGLAGVAAVAVAAVTLAPSWMAARVMQRAHAAVSRVSSIHAIGWSVAPDGSRTKREEWWQAGRRSRSEEFHQGRVELIAAGRRWVYEAKRNRVTVRRWRDVSTDEAPTLANISRGLAQSNSLTSLRLLGERVVDGRRLIEVEERSPDAEYRGVLRIDPDTDLLVQAEGQRREGNRWVTERFYEMSYNVALAESLFQPNFPKNATLFEFDLDRKVWEQRLARGIARGQVAADPGADRSAPPGRRTIVIRDLQVNTEGDVFALFTMGNRPGDDRYDWHVRLTDEFGTHYLPHEGSLMPTGTWVGPNQGKGFVFNGERLDGAWWSALEPQRPWKPRRFTLTFELDQVVTRDADGRLTDVRYTRQVSVPLAVQHPSTDDVPDYMPYVSQGPSEESVVSERIQHRAFYYLRRDQDLPRALALLRELRRYHEEQAREKGMPCRYAQTWIWIGGTLLRMDRHEEAIEAFEKALRETGHRDRVREEAQQSLETARAALAWSPDRAAPDFTVTDMTGQTRSLEQYRGQVLLIRLWAAFHADSREASPFKDEVAQLQGLYGKYHSRGLEILGVPVDPRDYEKHLRRFLKEHPMPWPQIWDGNGIQGVAGRQFGFNRGGASILVDRKGVIRHTNLTGAALEKAVAERVAEGG